MEARAPALLEEADSAERLPSLGGMARPDGIVIVSPRFWAVARVDGSLAEGEMPRVRLPLARVPLIRGLVRLGIALVPLFRGGGVARSRERALLGLALLASVGLAFVPHANVAGVILTIALVGWLFRGRTRSLHGAEHRAIAAAEERTLVGAWTGSSRPTRFAQRCGTNFAAIALPVTLLLGVGLPFAPAALIPVVSLALSMEIWQLVQESRIRALRLLLWPGLALQRLTTGEPSLAETRVALRAVESVLRRELALPAGS
jgi:uncharacterized protein YqhQ